MTVPVTVEHEIVPVATMGAALVVGPVVTLVEGLVVEGDGLDEHAEAPHASASTITADPTVAFRHPMFECDLMNRAWRR